MPALPPELLDIILASVDGPTAPTTLRSCSLVAHSFVCPSQRLLFRFLTLRSKTIAAVSARLAAHPHLASHVRDLHVDIHLCSKIYEEALMATFRLLSKEHVQRIAISSYSWQTWVWDSFSEDFRHAFVSLLRLPSVRCLALTRCRGVPLGLIRYALAFYEEVGLLVASVDAKQYCDFTVPPSAIDRGCTDNSLKHLLLNYSPTQTAALHSLIMGEGFSPPTDFHGLRRLELAVPTQGSLGGLENVATRYSASLQHLVVNFWQRHDQPVVLPALPMLKSLALKASVGRLRIPEAIVSTIINLPPQTLPNLEVLRIIVDAEYDASGKIIDSNRLCEVDMALTELVQGKQLREINWGIFSNDAVAFEERIRRVLPRTTAAATGRLLFSFSTWSWKSKHDPMVHFCL
ncbi:hypothetical protein R3P38DRAFT_3309921 [Favolaschia claudopus]|uniref:F-box domain-containing protein n=1 Tax=Favolaschia claudopus TaxID=2862362 RepID=A0AAW0CX57_9AGAR